MKFSFWQLEIFSIVFGIIVAIASCFWDGGQYFVWAYLAGALYALTGCFSLDWVIENAGSLFWEDDEVPQKAEFWMYGVALFCPIGAFIVGVIRGGAYLKNEYDELIDNVKTA